MTSENERFCNSYNLDRYQLYWERRQKPVYCYSTIYDESDAKYRIAKYQLLMYIPSVKYDDTT